MSCALPVMGLAFAQLQSDRQACGSASAPSSTPSAQPNAPTISKMQDMLLSKSEPLKALLGGRRHRANRKGQSGYPAPAPIGLVP